MLFLLGAVADAPPQWWQVWQGILAIPALAFGLVYSWLLIQKCRLEISKLRMEIAEKSKAAQEPDIVKPRDNPKQERIKFPLSWTLLSLIFILFLAWNLMSILSKTTPATPSDVFLLALFSVGILFYILVLMFHLVFWDMRRKKQNA